MRQSDFLRNQNDPSVLGYKLNPLTLTPIRRMVTDFSAILIQNPIEVVDFPSDPTPHTGIYNQIINLSSGTISALCGSADYKTIEAVQAELAFFYLVNHDSSWENWVDVWQSFCDNKLRKLRKLNQA